MERRRLFKEVQAAGYPGSYSQVKRYVRQVRPQASFSSCYPPTPCLALLYV